MFKVEYLSPIPYETRNLGMPSFSLNETFLENPNENLLKFSISEKTNKFNSLFIQARLAKENLNIAPVLQNCGFYFVESTLIPQSNLSKNVVLSKFIKNKNDFVPAKYRLDELNTYSLDRNDMIASSNIQEIAEESFLDDRFHIDPNCPDSIANKRFSYWISDLYSDENVIFYFLEHRNDKVGFMCHKTNDLILAGFNKKYRNSGLGEFLWLSGLEIMLNKGISQAKTLISVNNTSVLNLYSRLGFKFKHPSVTFHYWSAPKSI